MTTRLLSLAVLLASATAPALPCAAQDVAAPSPIARGRGLGWGVSAIVPMYVGDVRARDGTAIGYLAPGGGVEGRVFYELPGGIGLGGLGGVAVHASTNTRALAAYRAAVEARWAIDVGLRELSPLVALSVGALIAQVGAASVFTGYARVFGGVQVVFAPWVQLEAGLSLEGAIGADAFADAIAWVSPQVGVNFHE